MRRSLITLFLAFAVTIGFGVLSPAIPGAHAQSAGPTVRLGQSSGPSRDTQGGASQNFTVQVGSTVHIYGFNFTPNNWAFVFYQRPDGTTNGVFVPTTPQGTFDLTLGFSPEHGTGTEYIWAYDYATGRWSSVLAITVVGTTPVPVVVRQLSVSPTTVVAGSQVTVSGQGFSPNNSVYVYFQRPNGSTGAFWAQTDSSGAFTGTLGFLASNGCGTETIQAYDYGSGQWSNAVTVTVTGCTVFTAPTNLQVVSVNNQTYYNGQTSVTLSWQNANGAVTGYRVHGVFTLYYGGTNTQDWNVSGTSTTTTVTFVSGGFNPVTSACFTVQAVNGSAVSPASNQACTQL